MGHPLLWTAAAGQQLVEWLEAVERLLLGRVEQGYSVIGGVSRPDEPYGRLLAECRGVRELADHALGDGVVRVVAGVELGFRGGRGAQVRLRMFREGETVQSSVAESGAEVRGSVRLQASPRTTVELTDWIRQLAPLLPTPMPEWEPAPGDLPEDLFCGVICREREFMLSLDSAQAGSLLVISSPDRFGRDLSLLRSPVLVQRRSVHTSAAMAGWLGDLGTALSASSGQVRSRGPWRRLDGRPGGRVGKIVHGSPQLWVGSPVRILASGPAAGIGRWAAPLVDPAVHRHAAAGSPAGLVTWLTGVEQAVFGGPAVWRLDQRDAGAGRTAADLVAEVFGREPAGRAGVLELGPDRVTVGVTGSPTVLRLVGEPCTDC